MFKSLIIKSPILFKEWTSILEEDLGIFILISCFLEKILKSISTPKVFLFSFIDNFLSVWVISISRSIPV